jgi:hypothetical protein
MTFTLYETMDGTDKRFIVSYWETDNYICGGDPVETLEESVRRRALRLWFQLLQVGVEQAHQIDSVHGWTGNG